MLQEKALEIVKKHGKAMLVEMVDEIVAQALEEAAKKSSTPVDDIVVAALKEPLKATLKDLIGKI